MDHLEKEAETIVSYNNGEEEYIDTQFKRRSSRSPSLSLAVIEHMTQKVVGRRKYGFVLDQESNFPNRVE